MTANKQNPIDLAIARRVAEACVVTREVEGARLHPRNMILMMADEIEMLREHPSPTLRDYFASRAPAMPDQWWEDTKHDTPNQHYAEAQAAYAFFYAAAMLAERGSKT